MNYVNEMLEKKTWAVVGATPNVFKFGNEIYKLLKNRGYRVLGINPYHLELDGDPMYESLEDAMNKENVKIDCVSVIVPEEISKKTLEEADKLKIPYIWFQPKTYSQEWIESVNTNNSKIVYDHCVIVELAKR